MCKKFPVRVLAVDLIWNRKQRAVQTRSRGIPVKPKHIVSQSRRGRNCKNEMRKACYKGWCFEKPRSAHQCSLAIIESTAKSQLKLCRAEPVVKGGQGGPATTTAKIISSSPTNLINARIQHGGYRTRGKTKLVMMDRWWRDGGPDFTVLNSLSHHMLLLLLCSYTHSDDTP